VQLYELCAVLDNLDHLLDLLEAASVPIFYVWEEKQEEILAHFVVDDGLACDLLLLHRQLVEDPQTETQ